VPALDRWGEVFGDEIVAAAMIDRLVHHAEVISPKRRQLPYTRTRRPTGSRHPQRGMNID
jgi:DNA replication protein DnaC